MFLDFNSQKSWPAEVVVKVSGSCSPRTSGGSRLGTTVLKDRHERLSFSNAEATSSVHNRTWHLTLKKRWVAPAMTVWINYCRWGDKEEASYCKPIGNFGTQHFPLCLEDFSQSAAKEIACFWQVYILLSLVLWWWEWVSCTDSLSHPCLLILPPRHIFSLK